MSKNGKLIAAVLILAALVLSVVAAAKSAESQPKAIKSEEVSLCETAFNTPPQAAVSLVEDKLAWAIEIIKQGFTVESLGITDMTSLDNAVISPVCLRLLQLDYSKLIDGERMLSSCIAQEESTVWRFTVDADGTPVAFIDIRCTKAGAEFDGIVTVGKYCAMAQTKIISLCADTWQQNVRLVDDGIYLNYIVLDGEQEYLLSTMYLGGADDIAKGVMYPDDDFVACCLEHLAAAENATSIKTLPTSEKLIAWYESY